MFMVMVGSLNIAGSAKSYTGNKLREKGWRPYSRGPNGLFAFLVIAIAFAWNIEDHKQTQHIEDLGY